MLDDIKLVNTFKQCECGRDLRFDRLHQERTCPECGRSVVLSEISKQYSHDSYKRRQAEAAAEDGATKE